MDGIKKGILFCAVIGLVGLGILRAKSDAAEKAAEPVTIFNNTPHELYVRIGYVNHSARKADILDRLKPYETWTGGKSGPINAVTGYIYLPSGRKELLGFERKNYSGSSLKDSHSFEIKEVQGFWGEYQVHAQ